MVTDGWRVEPVVVQVSGFHPARQMLRVKRGPYFVADCRSVEEVAKHVDLAELGRSNGADGSWVAAPLEPATA